MMFSKKKITLEYTVEKCNNCGSSTPRKFRKGDVLFAEISKCQTCEGTVCIDKIFGEILEQ